MRTLIVGLIFFIAVPLASGTFQPSREVDFWRLSGFDLAQARRFFSNASCHAGTELFFACTEAFRQAGLLLGRDEFRSLGEDADFDRLIARVDDLAATAAAAPGGVPREMVLGVMTNTLLRHFDAHAGWWPADYLDSVYSGEERASTGIGIDEEVNGAGVFIRRVYPGTPAAAAGLRSNDRIVSIAAQPVKPGLKSAAVLKRLVTMAPDSFVDVVVEREGQQLAVSVRIARLSLPDVAMSFAQFGERTFAVASLRNFGHGVCFQLRDQLTAVQDRVAGLILDLRGNSGGALSEAACIMSLFSKQKKIVTKTAVQSPLPSVELHLALTFAGEDQSRWRAQTVFEKMPLVVLVNAFSASASEILSAALQDYRRAWIVGEPTFGKGSTQGVVSDTVNAKLRLVYTVSRYYRPSGGPLQLIGVTPNFVVPFESGATDLERQFPREGEIFGRKLWREDVAPWEESRLDEVRAIQKCFRKTKADLSYNQALRARTGFEDFQEATALGILSCSKF